MRRGQRIGLAVVLVLIAVTDGLAAGARFLDGRPWWQWLGSLLLALALIAAAVQLLRWRDRLPGWARHYELQPRRGGGAIVRCTRCQSVVLAVAAEWLMPVARLLTYLHAHHDSPECAQAVQAAQEATAALSRQQAREAPEQSGEVTS